MTSISVTWQASLVAYTTIHSQIRRDSHFFTCTHTADADIYLQKMNTVSACLLAVRGYLLVLSLPSLLLRNVSLLTDTLLLVCCAVWHLNISVGAHTWAVACKNLRCRVHMKDLKVQYSCSKLQRVMAYHAWSMWTDKFTWTQLWL